MLTYSIMPRKLLIKTNEFPYHITNRSNNRDFFYVPNELLWPIFINCLNELRVQYKCKIHSFVLMSNHYHLIISTSEYNIGEAMKYFHREVARQANKLSGRINHFFGGRYKWSLICDELYYWNCVKYIFRNPIRAGLCSNVNEYKFSSLNHSAELFSWNMTDFFHDRTKSIELNLDWLNEPFQKEHEQLIKKGLRRREFTIPKDRKGNTPILDLMLYRKGTVT